MTTAEIEALIDQYRSGLDTELGLLRRLDQLSSPQLAASTANDFDALNQIADVRDRLTTALVAVEEQLREIRHRLVERRAEARALPGYAEAVQAHHDAIALITRIVNADEASLESLNTAELARRDAVRAIEQGETTLAAYRKVVALASRAALVDRRG